MTTYTITRAFYSPWDGDPESESVVFVIDEIFQTRIRRGKFIGMTNAQVEARILNDCEWWDAKINDTNIPYEPTAGFLTRIATFVDDEITV